MSLERTLTYKGETLSVAEWSRRTGLKDKTIYMRIKAGWTAERAIERPLQKGFLLTEERKKRDPKAEKERMEEKEQIREWLRTQPAHVEERREEGDIL